MFHSTIDNPFLMENKSSHNKKRDMCNYYMKKTSKKLEKTFKNLKCSIKDHFKGRKTESSDSAPPRQRSVRLQESIPAPRNQREDEIIIPTTGVVLKKYSTILQYLIQLGNDCPTSAFPIGTTLTFFINTDVAFPKIFPLQCIQNENNLIIVDCFYERDPRLTGNWVPMFTQPIFASPKITGSNRPKHYQDKLSSLHLVGHTGEESLANDSCSLLKDRGCSTVGNIDLSHIIPPNTIQFQSDESLQGSTICTALPNPLTMRSPASTNNSSLDTLRYSSSFHAVGTNQRFYEKLNVPSTSKTRQIETSAQLLKMEPTVEKELGKNIKESKDEEKEAVTNFSDHSSTSTNSLSVPSFHYNDEIDNCVQKLRAKLSVPCERRYPRGLFDQIFGEETDEEQLTSINHLENNSYVDTKRPIVSPSTNLPLNQEEKARKEREMHEQIFRDIEKVLDEREAERRRLVALGQPLPTVLNPPVNNGRPEIREDVREAEALMSRLRAKVFEPNRDHTLLTTDQADVVKEEQEEANDNLATSSICSSKLGTKINFVAERETEGIDKQNIDHPGNVEDSVHVDPIDASYSQPPLNGDSLQQRLDIIDSKLSVSFNITGCSPKFASRRTQRSIKVIDLDSTFRYLDYGSSGWPYTTKHGQISARRPARMFWARPEYFEVIAPISEEAESSILERGKLEYSLPQALQKEKSDGKLPRVKQKEELFRAQSPHVKGLKSAISISSGTCIPPRRKDDVPRFFATQTLRSADELAHMPLPSSLYTEVQSSHASYYGPKVEVLSRASVSMNSFTEAKSLSAPTKASDFVSEHTAHKTTGQELCRSQYVANQVNTDRDAIHQYQQKLALEYRTYLLAKRSHVNRSRFSIRERLGDKIEGWKNRLSYRFRFLRYRYRFRYF